MKVRPFQIFRVQYQARPTKSKGFESYLELTKGRHKTPADINKGIVWFKPVRAVGDGTPRIPALLLHSNPLKEGSKENPWTDVIDSDGGYALYNGDNRIPERPALESRGNAKLADIWPDYQPRGKRPHAAPMLMFRQRRVNGDEKGFREFIGFGVPVAFATEKQVDAEGNNFQNVVLELALFSMSAEHEQFDWRWIDDRRDPSLSTQETLRYAPAAWKRWLENSSISDCVRNVATTEQHVITIDHVSRGQKQQSKRLDRLLELLESIDAIDAKREAIVRAEQGLLRALVFGDVNEHECCICRKQFPVELLVAAHVKRRAECSKAQKLDYQNNVFPMCRFGCDELFERGFIFVADGLIHTSEKCKSSLAVQEYVNRIEGQNCPSWSPRSEEYFRWHAERPSRNS